MFKQKKSFGPARTSRDIPGRSRDLTGRDLETQKVPWSRGPGPKEVQKSRDLKIGHVPGQWKPYCVHSLQAGIEFKKNLRVRFGKYGGLKLEYFWVVKSKKVKSFIRG